MKYIRTYESISPKIKPQIGDYAFVEPNSNRIWLSKEWRAYLKCHIGEIIEKYYYTYKIEFITDSGVSETLSFRINEIVDFSSNREDLSYVEDSNKFNI